MTTRDLFTRVLITKALRFVSAMASGIIALSSFADIVTTEQSANPVVTEACAPAKRFTDQDFETLKAQNSEFLIYFWSPFMPLSVRGRNEIEALAAKNHIPKVVNVLDFNQRICHKEIGLFADPAFDAKELAQRHVLNHFPTILYVRDSKILAQIPGYELPEKFSARIQNLREKDAPH